MKRNATAVWNGSGKEGSGTVTTQSTTLSDTQYSYKSRFEEGTGTNPEELIAAAHAGCFTMKLSFTLGEMGFTPTKLETKCDITLDPSQGAITESHLTVKGTVPELSEEQFKQAVSKAEKECPVSKLLNAKISSEATLEM